LNLDSPKFYLPVLQRVIFICLKLAVIDLVDLVNLTKSLGL